MAKNEALKATRLNLLWTALNYLAGKRTCRDSLEANSATRIEITVSGKFGRATVNETIVGDLKVGEPTSAASSSAAPADVVCAVLLRKVGDADAQARAMREIAEHFHENGTLPEVDGMERERVSMWLKKLRSTVTTTKRGPIVFAIHEG